MSLCPVSSNIRPRSEREAGVVLVDGADGVEHRRGLGEGAHAPQRDAELEARAQIFVVLERGLELVARLFVAAALQGDVALGAVERGEIGNFFEASASICAASSVRPAPLSKRAAAT